MIERMNSICKYCGNKMYPRMKYECYVDECPKFFLECPKCGSASPSTSFDKSFVHTETLVEAINQTLAYKFGMEDKKE